MKKIKIVGTLILLSTLVLFTGCENKKLTQHLIVNQR